MYISLILADLQIANPFGFQSLETPWTSSSLDTFIIGNHKVTKWSANFILL